MSRNHLAEETSPYLLQHADNPVDWYPWGEAALARARSEKKPILLSIGYSACHWCHVMAHESFEDADTAALMNELFVNIKVDREERPDLDKIYQVAQQMLTHGSGGWPLTMFLTAQQQPFFGGTYFPKEPRYGMPAFRDLLRRVAEYYRDHGAEIAEQERQLQAALAAIVPQPATGGVLSDSPLAQARAALERSFDGSYGGFSGAPKFPHANSIERCLRQWHAASADSEPDLKALYMASLTLTRMAEGGIYDQLGGGFARYSVDGFWMIPHFEKMLYDNGQLLSEYARAHLATGESLFARISHETADWVLRDMRSPEGAFFSSLDADSQGHEGRFYVWTPAEVQALLGAGEYAAFSRRFGLDRPANFEGEWHLHTYAPLEDVAAAINETPQTAAALIESARAKLLNARNLRIWPARDEKILTAWNALMIKGLAIAARVLKRQDLGAAASAAVDFIRHHLWREGRLLAAYKDGRARLPAYLDDYAFLIDALLELLQTRWRSRDLEFAQELAEVLLEQFEDSESGGFFFTAREHEKLIHRSKTFGDESLPSGNGIAASSLCRLGYLLGESRYIDAAERTLKAAWAGIQEYPQAHMSLVNALEDFLSSLQILVIRGDQASAAQWAVELGALYAPARMLFAIPNDAALPPALAAKAASRSTVAYLCTGMTCSAPMANLPDVSRALRLRAG
ncbi:MAG TPA: thioredoxin domain-containing protein [Steroidobacteraceae bacterium]|nr:thioredoxin domain-containing protein [Steroidobacteraceae bacterium]